LLVHRHAASIAVRRTVREPAMTTAVQTRPAPPSAAPKRLPQWRVLLHNDRVNYMERVVEVVVKVVRLEARIARERMFEAHRTGVALLMVTHREHAELIVEQLCSCRLVATAEPEA
jgi:ATP-dependent Clp protease adaptor protein ClpS